MKLRLIRDVFAEDFTLGQLLLDGECIAYTLEDTVREIAGRPVGDWKIPGMTAIPVGEYKVIITFSQRFQKHLPLLLDVKGFVGIRIHAGNSKDDTSGCVLLGTKRNEQAGLVLNSRSAMARVQPLIQAAMQRGEDVWISVV